MYHIQIINRSNLYKCTKNNKTIESYHEQVSNHVNILQTYRSNPSE